MTKVIELIAYCFLLLGEVACRCSGSWVRGARARRLYALSEQVSTGFGEDKEYGSASARRFSGEAGIWGRSGRCGCESQHSFVVPLARAGSRPVGTAESPVGIGRGARLDFYQMSSYFLVIRPLTF